MGLYWINVRDPSNVSGYGIPFYVKTDPFFFPG